MGHYRVIADDFSPGRPDTDKEAGHGEGTTDRNEVDKEDSDDSEAIPPLDSTTPDDITTGGMRGNITNDPIGIPTGSGSTGANASGSSGGIVSGGTTTAGGNTPV